MSDADHSDPAVVFGINPVAALLGDEGRGVESLTVQKGSRSNRIQEGIDKARKRGIKIRFTDRRALDKMTAGARHQGIAARVLPKKGISWEGLLDRIRGKKEALLLILDGIKDPRNLGAALRSAEAFGVEAVILPKDRTAPLSGVAVAASAGAAEIIDLVRVTNLARAIDELQEAGVFVVGLDGEADMEIQKSDLKGSLALAIGEEGSGLRRLTKEKCDLLAAIPMRGGTGSLNLSAAASVALYEAVRQRTA